MRLHVLGIAHVPTTQQQTCCAYTVKTWNMCRMMGGMGYHVTLYGTAGSDASIADEFVEVVSAATMEACYGGHDRSRYQFKWSVDDAAWREFHERARAAILARDDGSHAAVLCPLGWGHEPVTRDLPDNFIAVESGIGYRHTFAKYRVFESYAWMHRVIGAAAGLGVAMGRWYDCVIPNFIDPAHFEYRAEKADYFLYLGRLNWDKGYHVAMEAARVMGARCLVVGQLPQPPDDAPELEAIAKLGGTYIPAVGQAERAELLAGARVLFCPSIYVEPFGGVAVEAQASGTPVICTDYGAYTETVLHGVTGWRCHTLEDFLWAATHLDEIDPVACRDWAVGNYSVRRVAPMYAEYLSKLRDLAGRGWYTVHPERTHLDWLRKHYPTNEAPCTTGTVVNVSPSRLPEAILG